MNACQHIEDAVEKETAASQALNQAKEMEEKLVKSGRLFRIVKGKTVIMTTYPQKYEDGTQD